MSSCPRNHEGWAHVESAGTRAIAAVRHLAAKRQDEDGLGLEVAALHAEGLLAAPMVGEDFAYAIPATVALRLLSGIGGADLSLGRLYEGHLNALQLVALYGTAEQKRRVSAGVRGGMLLGVWGADGPLRFTVEEDADGGLRISGSKRYASGLGLVGMALVSYTDAEGGLSLLLLDVEDAARQDASTWAMRGMQGSQSGTFDFEGLTVGPQARLGTSGIYRREPYFVGGIWRCAAAQLGAIERLVALMAEGLAASGRIDHPLQLARVGEAIMAARTARLWVEDAAARIEAAETGTVEDVVLAVSLSAFARLAVEAAGMQAVALAERSIGLPAFSRDHPAERLMRDLSTYLRQANPDQVLLEHGRTLASRLPDLQR